jgi:hypothetical protein
MLFLQKILLTAFTVIVASTPLITLADDNCPAVSTIDEIQMAGLISGELSVPEKSRRLDEGISKLKANIKNKTSPSGKSMDEIKLAGCKNQLLELQQARKNLR